MPQMYHNLKPKSKIQPQFVQINSQVNFVALPAVDDNGASIAAAAAAAHGLHALHEHQQRSWVLRYAVIRPRGELELADFSLF